VRGHERERERERERKRKRKRRKGGHFVSERKGQHSNIQHRTHSAIKLHTDSDTLNNDRSRRENRI
jgi:hypothetical protein